MGPVAAPGSGSWVFIWLFFSQCTIKTKLYQLIENRNTKIAKPNLLLGNHFTNDCPTKDNLYESIQFLLGSPVPNAIEAAPSSAASRRSPACRRCSSRRG
jgi:hypothetical protein